ncbi:unnamed protein product [Rotaria sp. Silwood2]|nr:unnamed protein product [Rotaria sp. Silwood2]
MWNDYTSLCTTFSKVLTDYPIPSAHPERTEWVYDDTCEAEDPFVYSPTAACIQCHCSQTVQISCIDALRKYVGAVNASFIFTRLQWDEELANQIRSLSDPPSTEHPNDADQLMLVSGLEANMIQYKYFTNDSCELDEPCIGNAGWRRVLMFDSSDENVGGANLLIGEIYQVLDDYTQVHASVTNHGLYEYDTCHRHYHFTHYGSFTFGNSDPTKGKRAFCLISTGRQANAEWSSLWSPFYSCTYQGCTPGWTDTYQAGIPCQWIDITDYSTTNSSITGSLTAIMNQDNMLCEGQLVLDAQGNFTWEPTEFTAINGETVFKQKCVTGTNPSTLANNIHQIDVTIPTDGNGYVTVRTE